MPPSMRDAFREHHRLTEVEIAGLFKECIFAFDANVLLNIYRYALTTRSDLFRVLRHLQNRIWVPYQVCKEFYARRLDIIREQAEKYKQLSKAIQRTLSELTSGTFRKSGFLNVEELDGILRPAVEQATMLIQQQGASHPDLIANDTYLEELVSIVEFRIGHERNDEQFKSDCEKAKQRLDQQIPPGYRDAKKPSPDCYGDVFIWFELMELAKEKKRPIVFVTDDDKEDWWLIVAGKKLGPRP